MTTSFLSTIRTAFDDYAMPMFRRPGRLQVAALCYRATSDGPRVLLISSRGSGRWIIPKGGLMRGRTAREAAITEAWEEAGVVPRGTSEMPIGAFEYEKVSRSGLPVRCDVMVFALEVRAMEDAFPEASQRRRLWLPPCDAADLVGEPGLKAILRSFSAG